MTTAFTLCPKCGHVRRPEETVRLEQCPACGIYFAKWLTRGSFVPPAQRNAEADGSEDSLCWRDHILDRVLHVPADISGVRLWGRAALLVFLLVWGVRLGLMDYRDGEINQSFMHNILLPIHEAGHIFFIPFGEFMTILGGSLFQLMLPLIIAGSLLWVNRDAFGAAAGLWWAGASLLDLAPYIYDARTPQLIMLGGHTGEDGPHDWIYLLGDFNSIAQSQSYGAAAHHLGFAIMLLSLGAAAAALWRWYCAHREQSA